MFSLGKDANIIRLHDNLNILSKIIDEGAKYSDSLVIDLAYEIGFSYVDLLLYHKGLNFLDIARISFSTRNIEEYLSALINEVDPRSYDVLEGYIQQIKQQDRKLKKFGDFYEFLLRRKGYRLVEMQRLDEAEMIFNSLLEYPGSRDYAEGELKYI